MASSSPTATPLTEGVERPGRASAIYQTPIASASGMERRSLVSPPVYIDPYFSIPKRRCTIENRRLESDATVPINVYIPASGSMPNYKKTQSKLINDPINGHILVNPLCIRIIDTPQFQRLRDLKQLGGVSYVFPGGVHDRFLHSIGTSFLAGELATQLRVRQPELEISDVDIMCVEVAGLAHDLGHGPFSHNWDHDFIPRAYKIRGLAPPKWKHEDASILMLRYLIKVNNILLSDYGLTSLDLDFICELIDSKPDSRHGRPESKAFLYDIVANKSSGVDVDKLDYLRRDSHYLGIYVSYDYKRLMMLSRVCKFNDSLAICFSQKECWNIYELFHTRFTMFRRVYSHRVGKAVEYMISDILILADRFLKVSGTDGTLMQLSDTIFDMEAYYKVTDCILKQIEFSTSEDMSAARCLVERLRRRDLYKFIGECLLPDDSEYLLNDGLDKIASEICFLSNNQVHIENIIVNMCSMGYGMKNLNPVDFVGFYSSDVDEARMIPRKGVSSLLPDTYCENFLRIYCRSSNEVEIDALMQAFKTWLKETNFSKLRSLNVSIDISADDGGVNE